MAKFTGLFRHLPPALFFVAVAVAWTWPLALSWSTTIPGEPGDNLAFLWNVWWMRQALSSSAISFFHSDHLFAPFGIDLALHTHTALPAWIAATLLAPLSTVAAQNLVNLASLGLNGFAAYLLAWDRTQDRAASLVAGLVYGGSAYVSTHLLGHYNLICAWGLPLFVLCLLRAVERRSVAAAAAAGACVALTAWCDYYYVVYEAVLCLGIALHGLGSGRMSWARRPPMVWTRRILAALLLTDAGLVAAIVASGGFVTSVAGIRIVATRPTNPLAIGWLLLLLLALTLVRPRLQIVRPSRQALVDRLRLLAPLVAVAIVGMMPLLIGLAAIVARRLLGAGALMAQRSRRRRSGDACSGKPFTRLVRGPDSQPLRAAGDQSHREHGLARRSTDRLIRLGRLSGEAGFRDPALARHRRGVLRLGARTVAACGWRRHGPAAAAEHPGVRPVSLERPHARPSHGRRVAGRGNGRGMRPLEGLRGTPRAVDGRGADRRGAGPVAVAVRADADRRPGAIHAVTRHAPGNGL